MALVAAARRTRRPAAKRTPPDFSAARAALLYVLAHDKRMSRDAHLGLASIALREGKPKEALAQRRDHDVRRARRPLRGLLSIADRVKPTTKEALRGLRDLGIRVVMLTGDAAKNALAVGRELGLAAEDVVAGVLPDGKARVIEDLKRQGAIVAMAGDGINDAPALATAHVGIATGTGSDVAIESAGVTLVKGDLRGIVRAVRLGRGTLANIRQNLGLAFGYNVLAVPVAAGVLHPSFGLLLSPMLAASAMSFSSVSVIVNALRLRRAVA